VRSLVSYLLGVALFGTLLVTWVTHSRLQAERLAHAATKQEMLAARAAEEAKRRNAEQELIHGQESHAQEVKTLRAELGRARARADRESGRVREAADAAVERARAQCADSAAAGLREAADDPIGVLADVLGRADARAGVLADIADQRYIAGRACEQLYDAARAKLTEH